MITAGNLSDYMHRHLEPAKANMIKVTFNHKTKMLKEKKSCWIKNKVVQFNLYLKDFTKNRSLKMINN